MEDSDSFQHILKYDTDSSSYTSQNQYVTEQSFIDELRYQIIDKSLFIAENKMYNLDCINDFDIEDLSIQYCPNVIPKLNNNQIVRLELYHCEIKCFIELKLPSLKYLISQEAMKEGAHDPDIYLQNFGEFNNLQHLKLYLQLSI
ncbi:Hypothetical_protein [Hexamita inflata]|uniref:Hypothetical_protein n=1 Tax=Hexamita inflata TaxID=28002 RepID=A0AA86NUS1_9EUKA|nr:Hypothetical protein HINF_LOCUS12761 [Hexamita inflata]